MRVIFHDNDILIIHTSMQCKFMELTPGRDSACQGSVIVIALLLFLER